MTVIIEDPPTDVARRHPFTGRVRWFAAVVFAVGAVLQLAEASLEPEQSDTAKRLAWWTAHPHRMDWSQVAGILAIVFLLIGVAVMWRLCRADSPRLATTAAIVLATAMIGLGLVHGIELAARWALLSGHVDAARAILDAKDPRIPGVVGFISFLPAAVIGNLLMAAALWRSRFVPKFVAGLLVAFVILDFIVDQGVISHAMIVLTGLVLGGAIISGYRRTVPVPDSAAAH